MSAADPKLWMWAEALEMLDRAERLQRRFFHPPARAARPAWEPPVDLYETAEAYWIVVALPGVPPEGVEVVIDGGVVTVSGERPLPLAARTGDIHRIEIPHGRFERRIAMPPGRLRLGRRDLADGCLVLTLHKAER